MDILLKGSWTSVIFDGKNKAYGAYELRGLYDKYVTRALLISVSLFTLSIASPLILSHLNFKEEEPEVENVVVELTAPPPLDPNTPPPPPPPKMELPKAAAAVKFVPPVVEEDEKVQDEEPPTQEDLSNKVIASQDVEGEEGIENQIEEPAPAVVEAPKEEVFLVVEEMPEPEGGMSAMYKFIGQNLRYPRQATQMGLEGRVVVTFVVSPQGEITNPEVVKGIGGGCDEEAIRVIKLLPKWKPGRQNGRAVSVKFTVPIKFTLQ